MSPLKQLNSSDRVVQQMQSNTAEAIQNIEKSHFQDGNLLTSITLVSGQDNQVSHKLARQPQLWVLTDQNTNTTVWRTAWDSTFLTLQCGANCTINLWVA